ncbi:bifunctional riboflavin kinase/FAD synthetase [Flavobacterium sp.]|uniref:bifunctional riboflavin kinase/FAD synthetase n=1 Tax=Flavobacterium sp. TaxID=239 RepID=UPI0037BEDA77
MNTYNSISEFPNKKTVVTIGTFDGVHLGHKKVIAKIISNAEELNCESTVLTFFPHPRVVLQNGESLKLLNTIEEKKFLLDKLGLTNLIIHPFDNEFAQLSAEDFVKKILIDQLHVHKIIIGYDHRFGKNRSADIKDLLLFGQKYGFEVEQISAQEIDEIAISSTKIRTSLEEGVITLANGYLGYNYFFSGTVVKGNQLGRTLGFPTANIQIAEDYKLIPKKGVYIVKSKINGKDCIGMMNIGTRPTVDGKNQSIEVHFLDQNIDLYNKKITIELLAFIREEQKFESVEALKNQLEKDKQFCSDYINNSTV